MTQEVEVTIRLEVDASKDKEFIRKFMLDMEDTYTRTVSRRNRMEVTKFEVTRIREEAEIYVAEQLDEIIAEETDKTLGSVLDAVNAVNKNNSLLLKTIQEMSHRVSRMERVIFPASSQYPSDNG